MDFEGAKIQVTCHPGYDCAEVRNQFLILIQGILKKTLVVLKHKLLLFREKTYLLDPHYLLERK